MRLQRVGQMREAMKCGDRAVTSASSLALRFLRSEEAAREVLLMRSEALAVDWVGRSIRSRNAPISTKFLEDPEITWRSARA